MDDVSVPVVIVVVMVTVVAVVVVVLMDEESESGEQIRLDVGAVVGVWDMEHLLVV